MISFNEPPAANASLVPIIAPVAVSVIGVSDSKTPTVVVTPDHEPNYIVTFISPIVAIFVRFGYEFCISLAGSMAAGGITTSVLPHTDFISLLKPAVFLAACIAGIGLLKNLATVFSGLEKKFPLASGSV